MLWSSVLIISSLSTVYSVCLKVFQKNHNSQNKHFFIFSLCINLIQALVLLAMPPYSGWSFNRNNLLFGALVGALILGNYFFTMLAYRTGPLALSNSIFGLSILVPIAFGLFFWDESLSVTAIIGLVLFLISIMFVSNATYFEKETRKKTDFKWLLYVFLSLACNGATMIVSKQFARIAPDESKPYLLVYIACSMLLSILAIIIMSRGDHVDEAISVRQLFDKKYLLLCVVAGAVMAASNTVFMSAIGVSSSVFFFPATRGLTLIMVLILSYFLFRERLSKKAATGFILNALAILMLSLG
ncbi:MAG: EamA family transporter [Ruminococcaceae bacterium]|jgi:drug/metabolite transporter (DMT)-like permease|nr:EamA family transporter [Oscillospiraceae bacterium]